MATSLAGLKLKSALDFNPAQYPNLRRMLSYHRDGCCFSNYRFTEKAAGVIEQKPEILLHFRLYPLEENRRVLYKREGREVCAVRMAAADRFLGHLVQIVEGAAFFTPEELADNAGHKVVELRGAYPAPFLPFDLDVEKIQVESALRGGRTAYKSREIFPAIYRGVCPLHAYQTFHFLTRFKNPIYRETAGIRKFLELGAGLGIVSLIVAQLLPGAVVDGIEIDRLLMDHHYSLRRRLERDHGYRFANARLRWDDVTNLRNIKIEDYDAVYGWFPLNHNVPESKLIELFQRLRPGALVLQYTQTPLKGIPEEVEQGFREVEIKSSPSLPLYVFRRL